MKKLLLESNNEGFVLIFSLLMLLVLSVIGVAALSTSGLDTRIAGNERISFLCFSTADSGWRVGGQWLESYASTSAPEHTDKTDSNASAVRDDTDVIVNGNYRYALVVDQMARVRPVGFSGIGNGGTFIYKLTATGSGPSNSSDTIVVGLSKYFD